MTFFWVTIQNWSLLITVMDLPYFLLVCEDKILAQENNFVQLPRKFYDLFLNRPILLLI